MVRMKRGLRLVLGLAVLLGAGWLAAHSADLQPQAIVAFFDDQLAASPWRTMGLFILAFAVTTMLLVPGSLMTLAGGALFGPWLGTLINVLGASLGAIGAFLIARFVAGHWVRERIEASQAERFKRILAGVEEEGWRFVAFTRLVPLFPYFLLNFAYGFTRIGLWPYTLSSIIFGIPGAAAFTWFGYVGREAVTGGNNLLVKGLWALAFLALMIFMPRLVQVWKPGRGVRSDQGGQ